MDIDNTFDEFYHSEKLQSTKTSTNATKRGNLFYHSEKLQSTKTGVGPIIA